MKEIFKDADLDSECVSNHSLRATCVSRLYEKGVPEKLIMERSGHLSISGVRSYERTTSEQQKSVSDVLSNGTKMPLVPINSSFQGNTLNGGFLPLAQPKRESEKENDASMSDASEVLKHLIFQNVDSCLSISTLDLSNKL